MGAIPNDDHINEAYLVLADMPIALRPPEEIDYVELPDYAEIAGRFAGYRCSIGELRPDGRVLDVGCGLGPLALGLADYLNADGRYEGLDIIKVGIEWCQREITSRFSNFHFHLADVQNNNTNPHGRFASSSYSFPYKDESFDLVFKKPAQTTASPSSNRQCHTMLRRPRIQKSNLYSAFSAKSHAARRKRARRSIPIV